MGVSRSAKGRTLVLLFTLAAAALCPLAAGQSQWLPSVNRLAVSSSSNEPLPTTCRLVVEGGSNKTEIQLLGTSIAFAQLECSGAAPRIAVHPLLAPFVPRFKGVKVASVVSLAEIMQGRAQLSNNASVCAAQDNMLLLLCKHAAVEFVQTKIYNVKSPLDLGPDNSGLVLNVLGTHESVVRFVDPVFRDVHVALLFVSGIAYFERGTVERNTGLGVWGGGVMVFNQTRFTANRGLMLGGAVTVMYGDAFFFQCMFDSNTAPSMEVTTGGAAAVGMVRSGLGGAVLGYEMGRGRSTAARTSVRFEGCSFTNNSASEGGAVAMVGADVVIQNCSFLNNAAGKTGFDVYSGLGGALKITRSNIVATDDTVTWERNNASQCFVGEYFAARQGVCLRCLPSTYGLTIPADTCHPCPANAQCPGGSAISPNKGFWRASNLSTEVISCPRSASCLQGGTCAEGHEGVVCGSCSKGYALALSFKCAKCASRAGAVGVFVASLTVLLFFTGIAIQLTRVSNRVDPASRTGQDPDAGDIIKLLALFLQYVSIIGSLPVPWPSSLLGMITASDWVFASATGHTLGWVSTPFECVLKGLRVPSAVAKQLVNLAMPFVVIAAETVVFLGVYVCCLRRRKQLLQLPVVLLVSAFFTFPIWVRAVFSFFACYSVQDATLSHALWWAQEMSQPCYHGYHKAWASGLAIPCTGICLAAPLLLFVGLWRSKSKMTHATFRARYGHLYRLYCTHAYGYEAVILGQTIALVAVAVFASQIGSYVAVLLAGLHISVSLQLLQVVRPYTYPLLHRVHTASLWWLLINVFVALLMFADGAEAQARSLGVARAAVAAFALALNASFVIGCCVFTVRCFLQSPGGSKLSKAVKRWVSKLAHKQQRS